MGNETHSNRTLATGATVVISHRVSPDQHDGYDQWLNEISPICRASPGYLDLQVVRPISGLTSTYTVVIRFETRGHLEGWMSSPERTRMLEQAKPLLATEDSHSISSGLDFWFTPEGAEAKVPIRWKQALVTWSAIYPLVLVVPLIVLPLLRQTGLPANRYLDPLVVTGTLVWLMVYVVMPRYTRLIQGWLFR